MPLHDLERELVLEIGRDRVSSGTEDRRACRRDLWPLGQLGVLFDRPFRDHDLVVWPESTEEVAKVVRAATSRGIAVVPFGAGSGVCGGTISLGPSVVLDLKRMDRVVSIDAARRSVRAEAGIVGEVLERRLSVAGFTLGHFPSSIYCSTLGGWLAARSAGQLSTLYGKIEDMVLDIEAVTGAGEVVRAADLGGPDGVQLLLGTEGTAAVVTAADLAIHPSPESREFLAARFRGVEAGLAAIHELLSAGVIPAAVRLYDHLDTLLVGRSDGSSGSGLSTRILSGEGARERLGRLLRASGIVNALGPRLPTGCLLILTFEGPSEVAEAANRTARRLLRASGARDLDPRPARRWWDHRYDVSYKQSPVYARGGLVDTIEVAATWDRLLPLYRRMRAAIGRRALVLAHFSHAYREGCSIYFTFVISAPDFESTRRRYETIWRWALEACRRSGATITHHHGVGLLKARAYVEERAGAWPLLTALGRAFDPSGRLNPGKIAKPLDGEKFPPANAL